MSQNSLHYDIETKQFIQSIILDSIIDVEKVIKHKYLHELEIEVVGVTAISILKKLISASYLQHDSGINNTFQDNVDFEPEPIPNDSLASSGVKSIKVESKEIPISKIDDPTAKSVASHKSYKSSISKYSRSEHKKNVDGSNTSEKRKNGLAWKLVQDIKADKLLNESGQSS